MTEQPLVYVVILNRDLKDDTAQCIESVLKSSYRRVRIVVVDNGSTDGSVEHIRSRFPHIEVMANERNLGFTGGNNMGMQYALDHGADYVLILNNDTIVDEHLLTHLVEVGQSDAVIGMLGPLIFYYEDRDRIWYFAEIRYRFVPIPLGIAKGRKFRGQFEFPVSVDYISGCAMLIKREVLEKVGMFQERLFWYYEDPDLCCRIRDAGYKIVAVPSARMWHKVSLTGKKVAPFARYLRTRNRVIFYKQHRHGPHPLLTHVYLILDSIRVASLDLWRSDVDLLAPLVLGLYDGYRGDWDELRYNS